MARRSRKAAEAITETAKGKTYSKYHVAIYARLSKEKEETIERGTIENQINMVKDFVCRQSDMEIADIYVDDSVSGTSFDRPGFDRLIADMKKGLFNTIAVKDLSRLGRDYIETGNLIERIFPLFGIRFIAITDGYDSVKAPSELMVSVTNIANALYAQDISRKICSSKRTKMEQGIPVGTVVYGYRIERDAAGKRIMVIDDEPAEVIREIYRRFIAGEKKMSIAAILNGRHIPTPFQYRFRDQPEKLAGNEHLQWTLANITKILQDETYTGKYVIGKDIKRLYLHEKRHIAPDSEWLVFENHHPSIISREYYDKAQAMVVRQGYVRQKEENIFRGKVVCGCCGSAYCVFKNHGDRYYMCAGKRRYGAKNSGCSSNSVSKKYFYDTVFDAIQDVIRLLLDEEAAIRAYQRSEKGSMQRMAYRESLDRITSEISRSDELKNGLYADFCEGLLSEDEYLTMNRQYTEKVDLLRKKLAKTKESIKRFDALPMDNEKVGQAIREFKGKRKLTKQMVEAFIERITVYENRRMEIRFGFDDELKLLNGSKNYREAAAQ